MQKTIVPIIVWLGFDPFRPVHNHRDYEVKFEMDDISDKMRQAALFATAPKAVVENRLAGGRDLDNYA